MRCLTLAHALHSAGARVDFVCREHDGHMCSLIESAGFAVQRLSNDSGTKPALNEPHASWLGTTWEKDANQSMVAMKRISPHIDWLIVDHYALDKRWETFARSNAAAVMVIDDLADRAHNCDILLDHNFYPELQSRYDSLTAMNCVRLLGPEFALLRPEFVAARERSRRDGHVKRILVSFGNSDLPRATLTTLRAIAHACDATIRVDIVIGAMYEFMTELESLCSRYPQWTIHGPNNRMAQLMIESDLAFGGGGVTTWERCCVGLPCLIMALAFNQIAIAEAAQTAGIAVYLGEAASVDSEATAARLGELMNDPALVMGMSMRAARLVDGRGAERACSALLGQT